jgi:hypothetical protein
VVEQRGQAVGHVVPGGDRLGCLEVKPVSERRQLLEEQLLAGLEELIAPGHSVFHGEATGMGIAVVALQQRAGGVEPIEDLRRREHPTPGGHQLDRKGQAVGPATDLLDRLGLRRLDAPFRRAQPGSIPEQVDR